MTGPERTRKPCEKPAPYTRQPRTKKDKNAPKTSAKPVESRHHENLTLHDWKTVFAFIDAHPAMSQGQVIDYFKTKQDGALIFTQSTLSRKMKNRSDLEACTDSYPNVLSSKRPRVVTWPDVEKALILWVRHMEAKGETVNSPMLHEKRARFEKAFDVPQEEQLIGDGWVPAFCSAYKMKEYQRHGEAGSVDLEAMEVEQRCVQGILMKFAPRNRFNIDETGFFAL
jgi:hypothetical protein